MAKSKIKPVYAYITCEHLVKCMAWSVDVLMEITSSCIARIVLKLIDASPEISGATLLSLQ